MGCARQSAAAAHRQGLKNVVVSLMPSIVGLAEVIDRANGDANQCVSRYYGLQSVTAR